MIRVLVAAWMSLAFSSVPFAQAKPAAPVTAAPAPEINTKPDQATVLTRLLHSGFIREKSEQNDGVAVLEESGGSVSIGERRVLQNRLQREP